MTTSPDKTRLAAALAKIDDPEIVALLLDAYMAPTPAPAPPAEPAQQTLITMDAPRPPKNQQRRWRTNEIYQLRAMVNGGETITAMAERFHRSERAVSAAIERHVRMNPVYRTKR